MNRNNGTGITKTQRGYAPHSDRSATVVKTLRAASLQAATAPRRSATLLPVTCNRLLVTRYPLLVTGYRLLVTRYRLLVTGYPLPLIFFTLLLSASAFAQNCEKKLAKNRHITENWDFKSQSVYTQLASNDTIRIKTIVYQKFDYRIFAICEPRLGRLHYRIYQPEKRFESTVEKITEKETVTYQRDDKGFLIYDDDENPIPTGTAIVNDTTWARTLSTFDKILFDSNVAETQFWESKVQKTELLIVEIIIPKTKRFHFGCIGLMVGRAPYTSGKHDDDTPEQN